MPWHYHYHPSPYRPSTVKPLTRSCLNIQQPLSYGWRAIVAEAKAQNISSPLFQRLNAALGELDETRPLHIAFNGFILRCQWHEKGTPPPF